MRHFGIQSRRAPSGAVDGISPAYGGKYARAGSNSYLLPPQSILHGEDFSHSPLEIGAFSLVVAFGLSIGAFLIGTVVVLRLIGL